MNIKFPVGTKVRILPNLTYFRHRGRPTTITRIKESKDLHETLYAIDLPVDSAHGKFYLESELEEIQ